jgi:hypothetical protein
MRSNARFVTPHLVALALTLTAGCGDDTTTPPDTFLGDIAVAPDLGTVPDLRQPDLVPDTTMSFFISSRRGSANLATAAGVTGKKWAAYLSAYADGGQPAVNARDRIGKGPWYNAKGAKIADDVASLHNNAMMGLIKTAGLDEKGTQVPGRGDMPNEHDILTGSMADGKLNAMATCKNWTFRHGDVPQLDLRHGHDGRQRDGGALRPHGWRRGSDVVELGAQQLGLQRAGAHRHRRRRPHLLLRRAVGDGRPALLAPPLPSTPSTHSSAHGWRSRMALPSFMSNGTELCWCVTSQRPPTLR